MNNVNEFHNLGFDLVDLNKVVYLGIDPNPDPVDDCKGGKCTVSCTNGCASCSPGNKN